MVDPDDPRVERSRRVILTATLEELGAVGYGALTIEGVAARAGVGKSTIYRHWDGKLTLVEDAFRTLKGVIDAPPPGPVRVRVEAILRAAAAGIADSTYTACLPALVDAAERDPAVAAFHRKLTGERRQVLVDVLRDGVEAGELPPDADPGLLSEALVGPIMIRRLLLQDPMPPDEVPHLVDQVLPRVPASDRPTR